jgi:nucleotide-binding universal stress UspA family protein
VFSRGQTRNPAFGKWRIGEVSPVNWCDGGGDGAHAWLNIKKRAKEGQYTGGMRCAAPAKERGAMIVLKNILVATDFSEPSANALAYGRDLARAYNATLHVLHVTEDVLMRYSPEVGFAVPDLQKDLEQAARRELDAIITADDVRTLRVVPAIETATGAANGITSYATAQQIDLIIVGTHGRGAVKQFLMGSVAERVVRTAPCPVLAVRAHEREFIAPDALQAAASR